MTAGSQHTLICQRPFRYLSARHYQLGRWSRFLKEPFFISASLHNGCYKLRGTHPTLYASPRDTTGVTDKNVSRFDCCSLTVGCCGNPAVVLGSTGMGMHGCMGA